MQDALSAIERIGTPRVLVIGDVMLDRCVLGTARHLNSEAPMPVWRSNRHEARLGGAGAVTYLLRGLDAKVTLCGIIGDDANGRILRGLLNESAIDHSLVVEAGRPTRTRQQVVGCGNRCPCQTACAGREVTRSISDGSASHLLAALRKRLPHHDVLLVSDHRKGACSCRLLSSVISAASEQGIATLVDPARGADYSRYRRASLIKLNRVKAQIASGVTIRCPEDALTAGRLLCQQSRVASILVTLDAEGMAIVLAGGKGKLITTRPRAVHDATGAGDMVLAMLGLCRAAGIGLGESVYLANIAAGIEVERFGLAQISRDDIRAELGVRPRGREIVSLDELLSRQEDFWRAHQTIAGTNDRF